MTNFENALKHLFSVEGGYSDHALDRGGATKYGITLATLEAWRGQKLHSKEIENLTREEATAIYKAWYWDISSLDRIDSPKLTLFLFDQSVNCGPVAAVKMLQETLNSSFGEKLQFDGKLGENTQAAISRADEAKLIRKLLQKAQYRYAAIVAKDPSQVVFLKGWLNRTFTLWDELA